jgi:hypothetical protein
MVYEFLGLLVESYGTWLLLQRLVDASKDSDIPKNVPFAFAINNRNSVAGGGPRSTLQFAIPMLYGSALDECTL